MIRSDLFTASSRRFFPGVRANVRGLAVAILMTAFSSGCAVVTVADAVVTVASTAVKVTATVVETTVDVAAAGVKAVAGSSEEKK